MDPSEMDTVDLPLPERRKRSGPMFSDLQGGFRIDDAYDGARYLAAAELVSLALALLEKAGVSFESLCKIEKIASNELSCEAKPDGSCDQCSYDQIAWL